MPTSLIKRILRIALGVISLLVGIAGGFIPIFQGWIFVLFGLYLLSYDIPYVRRLFKRLKERFPRHAAGFRRTESRMILRWRKLKAFFRRKPPHGPSPSPTPPAGEQGKPNSAK